MAKLVKAINSFDQNSQLTYLASDVASGVAALPWDNPSGFSPSWGIQLGATGQEKSEVLVLGTAALAQGIGTATSNTLYPHPQDTPIYAIYYDKLIFKRASGTAGTATPLSSGTVAITPDSKYTTFYDSSGADSYYYKVAPYNSVLDIEGVESDWLSASGYSFYSLKKIRDRVKNKLHSTFINDDSVFDDWINEWLETMNNSAVDVNKDYSLSSEDVAVGTSGLGTITSADYKDVRKVEFTTDGTNYGTASRISINNFDMYNVYSPDKPCFYFADDNVIGIKPDDTAGTARVHFYHGITVLSNDTDSLPVVMRPYTKSFVDYCKAQASYLDKDMEAGDRFMNFANSDMTKFIKEITPRHKTGTKFVKLDSPTDGQSDTGYYWD